MCLTGILDIPGEWRGERGIRIVAHQREDRDSCSGEFGGERVLEKITSGNIFHTLCLNLSLFNSNVFLSFYLQDNSLSTCLAFYKTSPRVFQANNNPSCSCALILIIIVSFYHSSVLTMPINFLIYNLSPHAIGSLILSISRKLREHFSLRVKGFVTEYPFLWGQLLKCFSGNSVGVVYSELNCRFFRSGKELKKQTNNKNQPHNKKHDIQSTHLTDEKTGSHSG